MTPELYLPCLNCDSWRYQHVGKEKKCLFGATHYEPTPPAQLTVKQVTAVRHRACNLRDGVVERMREELERFEEAVDRVEQLAIDGCEHIEEDGSTAVREDAHPNQEISKRHFICHICDDDWYDQPP